MLEIWKKEWNEAIFFRQKKQKKSLFECIVVCISASKGVGSKWRAIDMNVAHIIINENIYLFQSYVTSQHFAAWLKVTIMI